MELQLSNLESTQCCRGRPSLALQFSLPPPALFLARAHSWREYTPLSLSRAHAHMHTHTLFLSFAAVIFLSPALSFSRSCSPYTSPLLCSPHWHTTGGNIHLSHANKNTLTHTLSLSLSLALALSFSCSPLPHPPALPC